MKYLLTVIFIIVSPILVLCQTTIHMKRHGNLYKVHCKINGIPLDLFFDTGADDVTISITEAAFMFKNGQLTGTDIIGREAYKNANGEISYGTTINLRYITIGDVTLTNVKATIIANSDAPLLFGQSAIKKLGTVQIDPSSNTLTILNSKNTINYGSAPNNEATKHNKPFPPNSPNTKNFIELNSGLKYRIYNAAKSKAKCKVGDEISLHITASTDGLSLYNSREDNKQQPVSLVVTSPRFQGDIMEGFTLLSDGDSAVFLMPSENVKNQFGNASESLGATIQYNVKVTKVIAKERVENQVYIDDSAIVALLKAQKITAKRTFSGLYYTIENDGHGELILPGQKAVVYYTGKRFNGDVFDTNTDPSFGHTDPFIIEVGKGKVIKGFDEGLQILRMKSKATFYIPSTLAYGRQAKPGMPANSILIFSVYIDDLQ